SFTLSDSPNQEDAVASRKILAFGVLALLVPFAPLAAFGQGGTSGSIIGFVYDQTGAPLRGVRASAISPTQIGGAQIAYSDGEGQFRIRQLFPGTFELRLTAPKLKTVIQKDIRVGI